MIDYLIKTVVWKIERNEELNEVSRSSSSVYVMFTQFGSVILRDG